MQGRVVCLLLGQVLGQLPGHVHLRGNLLLFLCLRFYRTVVPVQPQRAPACPKWSHSNASRCLFKNKVPGSRTIHDHHKSVPYIGKSIFMCNHETPIVQKCANLSPAICHFASSLRRSELDGSADSVLCQRHRGLPLRCSAEHGIAEDMLWMPRG